MKKYVYGVFAALTVFGAAACSSSSSNGGTPSDAATDTHKNGDGNNPEIGIVDDSGNGGETGPQDFGKTTGKPCTDDKSCDPNNLGIEKCTTHFKNDDGFPDAVCFAPPSSTNPTPCTPGDQTTIQFCDAGLGICVDLSQTGGASQSACFPACQGGLDGTAVTGCVGKAACDTNNGGVVQDPTTQKFLAVGTCTAACETDTDCSKVTGTTCQKETGECVDTSTKTTFTKTLGASCTQTADDPKAPGGTAGCLCLATSATAAGYCTMLCTVGSTTCGTGYVCTAGFDAQLKDNSGNVVLATVKEPNGLSGFCAKKCTTDTDCTVGKCTTNTTATPGWCAP